MTEALTYDKIKNASHSPLIIWMILLMKCCLVIAADLMQWQYCNRKHKQEIHQIWQTIVVANTQSLFALLPQTKTSR